MRVTHNLWRVSNGWILLPEECFNVLDMSQAPKAAVFKTLKEFADYKPKRVRKPRTKPTKEINNANIN